MKMNTTKIYFSKKGLYKEKSNTEFFFFNEWYILQIPYFHRIDVSEGIEVNKTSATKE